MTFTPEQIESREFVPALRGYNRSEVRAFLRAVAADLRRQHAGGAITDDAWAATAEAPAGARYGSVLPAPLASASVAAAPAVIDLTHAAAAARLENDRLVADTLHGVWESLRELRQMVDHLRTEIDAITMRLPLASSVPPPPPLRVVNA